MAGTSPAMTKERLAPDVARLKNVVNTSAIFILNALLSGAG
jgi:hypothetical protein